MKFINPDYLNGPVAGSGPGFDRAMRLFSKRQAAKSTVGQWRYKNEYWKKDNGSYIDRDWDIIDY